MTRFPAVILGLASLLPLTSSTIAQSNPSNQTDTVAKSDAALAVPMAKNDALSKVDAAANIEPLIKANHNSNAAKAAVPPPPDGNELAESCKAEVEGFDAGYCLGVIEGVIAFMNVCKPDHSVITLGEAADATARYLETHPQKLKQRDVVLARKALSKAYPCGVARK